MIQEKGQLHMFEDRKPDGEDMDGEVSIRAR